MPLYMDIHTIEGGVDVEGVAKAHMFRPADAGQVRRALSAVLVNEPEGMIFCLVEAPSASAAETVHREAHGLVADDVYEVRRVPDEDRSHDRGGGRRGCLAGASAAAASAHPAHHPARSTTVRQLVQAEQATAKYHNLGVEA